MGCHARDHVAVKRLCVLLPGAEPFRRVLVADERRVERGVAKRPERVLSCRRAPEAHAVGATLHADLVPQVVKREHAAHDLPGADARRVANGARRSLGYVAHGGGNGEGLVFWGGAPQLEHVCCPAVRGGLKTQPPAKLPEAREVLGRTREAHGQLV